jgi:hypothetical protein
MPGDANQQTVTQVNPEVASLTHKDRDDPLKRRENLATILQDKQESREWFCPGYQGRYAEKDYAGNLGYPPRWRKSEKFVVAIKE